MTSSLAESLGAGHTAVQWAHDFLVRIGAPPSPANIGFVVSWEKLESGGGGGQYNPLNSVLGAPGATTLNSAGVKNYTTYQQGIEATAQTFLQTQWAGVVRALRANDQQGAQAAINAEYATWGGGPLNILGTSAGNVTGSGGGASASTTSTPGGGFQEHCILNFPKASLGPVHLGGQCLLHSNQGRALLGAFCLVTGGALMLIGLGFVAIGGNSPLAKVAPLLAAAA